MKAADPAAIRDAATVILVRDPGGPEPSVLMGQRGRGAAFMPDKFVFPGGAVDPEDAQVGCGLALTSPCTGRLGPIAGALAAAALRELWEETGQILARPGPAPPWPGFAAGLAPDAGALRYVFRAITPMGRPRRFDARFFAVDAAALATDPADFSGASGELSNLHWVPLSRARALDVPFVTEVALAEVAGLLPALAAPDSVPFFDNSGPAPRFERIA